MIKLRLQRDGGPVYILGLSHKNLEGIRAGLPIAFPIAELLGPGAVGDICIMAGKDEPAMMRELEKETGIAFGPEAYEAFTELERRSQKRRS